MKKYGILAGLVVLLVLVGAIILNYYEYVFAKTVKGKILRVERVMPPESVIMNAGAGATGNVPSQLFSFAVSIKDETGEIHTASTEDRQWAVAQPGQCVEAKFFPYPPWNLQRANTYHGARLERLFECK